MHIAQVAPLTEAIPPKLYGGTERVVSWLTEELIALGHDVTLFASGDSITSANLEAAWPRALRLDGAVRDPNALHMHRNEGVPVRVRARLCLGRDDCDESPPPSRYGRPAVRQPSAYSLRAVSEYGVGLTIARTLSCSWRSTVAFLVPPSGSPHTTCTSVPSSTFGSTVASDSARRSFAL